MEQLTHMKPPALLLLQQYLAAEKRNLFPA